MLAAPPSIYFVAWQGADKPLRSLTVIFLLALWCDDSRHHVRHPHHSLHVVGAEYIAYIVPQGNQSAPSQEGLKTGKPQATRR